MKKWLVVAMVFVLAVGPLFRGLFFAYEMFFSFAMLAFLGGAYLFLKWRDQEALLLRHSTFYCGLGLLAAYLLSFFTSVNLRGNLEAVMQLIVYLLIFVVLFDYFREHKEQISTYFFIPLTMGGLVSALLGIAGYTRFFTGDWATINSSRIHSTLQYANTAAVYFLLIALLLIALIINTKKLWMKAMLAGVGHVLLMALFFTSSRGVFLVFPPMVFLVLILVMPHGARFPSFLTVISLMAPMVLTLQKFNVAAQAGALATTFEWLIIGAVLAAGLMVAFGAFLRLQFSTTTKYMMLALTGIVVILVGVMKGPFIGEAVKQFVLTNIPQNVLNRMQDINLETNSVVMRFEFYKEAWTLIQRQWWLGYGGGGFASLYQSVQKLYYAAKLVHNHYLQVFVESGILGIISFIGLVLVSAASMFYGRLRQLDFKHRVESAAVLSAFLALALHSAIDFNLSFSSMGYLLWGMIAIGAAYGVSASKNVQPLVLPKISIQWASLALIAVVGLASVSFSLAGYQMDVGSKAKKQIVAVQAITAYEKASMYDPLNAGPKAELADLYAWMAYTSDLKAEKDEWLEKAVRFGERAIQLDRYYPYYNRIMTKVYFQVGMNVKAAEQALFLVEVQPLVKANYEFVVKGYVEGGLQLLREGNVEQARQYFENCIALMNDEVLQKNKTITFYAGKAALIMGSFENAETWLTTARSESLELKMEVDRLLYLLNQQTGRDIENEKYQGLLWMGYVEVTPVYKEIKGVLESGILRD